MSRAYTGQPEKPYLLAPALTRDLCAAVKQEPEFHKASERGRRTLVGLAVAAAVGGQDREGQS